MVPLVTVITPCYNSKKYLPDTIHSVLGQNGNFEVQYIIVDGNSNDGTREYLESFSSDVLEWVSEKDKGMYDALVKGFKKSKGDIICYINAGDILLPGALSVVVDLFTIEKIEWLTGRKNLINESNHMFSSRLPWRYNNKHICSGSYIKSLPFIQQESTFWSKSALQFVDFETLSSFRYAGDYYLWYCFAKNNLELVVSDTYLGAFKIHDGQLSESLDKYRGEVVTFVGKSSSFFSIIIEKVGWKISDFLKKRINRRIVRYDQRTQKWSRG